MTIASLTTTSLESELLQEVRLRLKAAAPLQLKPELVQLAAKLSRLELNGIPLRPAQLEECARLFTSLTHLSLIGCSLTDEACEPLQHLKLQELDLSRNPELEGGFVRYLPVSITHLVAISVKIPTVKHNELWRRIPALTLTLGT
jgi:hypothetical protein